MSDSIDISTTILEYAKRSKATPFFDLKDLSATQEPARISALLEDANEALRCLYQNPFPRKNLRDSNK